MPHKVDLVKLKKAETAIPQLFEGRDIATLSEEEFESFKQKHVIPGFNFERKQPDQAWKAEQKEKLRTIGVHPSEIGKGNIFRANVTDPDTGTLSAFPPTQPMSAQQIAMYKNNDWNQLIPYLAQSQANTQPVYTNIQDHAEQAFVKVVYQGHEYSLSYSQYSTFWIWPQQLPADHPASLGLTDDSYSCYVSLGSYAAQTSYAGISSYVITNIPINVTLAVISTVMAKLFSDLVKKGLTLVATAIVEALSTYLVEAGWIDAALTVNETLVSALSWVGGGALAAGITLCLQLLLSWLLKSYGLVVNVYNFDPNNDWQAVSPLTLSNADQPKDATGETKPLIVPKYIPAGTDVGPPGFNPVQVLQGVISYFNFTLQNSSVWSGGLSVAMEVDQTGGTGKFYAGYHLWASQDNTIGITGDVSTAIGDWVNNPNNFQAVKLLTSSVGNPAVALTASTPELGGASQNLYRYQVNIGTPPPPPS